MTVAAVQDPLQKLGGTRRAFVVPDLKLLYISVAKNACTSIKWMVSELAGEDPRQFDPGGAPYVSAEEGIHLRSRWTRTPTLNRIAPELRAAISPANGWFVFGVVRDPRARLFSAWQNKFLLRSPAYAGWREEPWYPRIPDASEQVGEDFAKFVAKLRSDPGEMAQDAHFLPQTPFLAPDVVPYSGIYDVGDLSSLLSDLDDHLRGIGWDGVLRLRRSNDTPLRATARMFDGPVRAQVEDYFAEDFERFGHLWDFGRIEANPEWSAEALTGVRAQIAMSERIRDLLDELATVRERNARKRAKIEELQTRVRGLRTRVRKLRLRNVALAEAATPGWRRLARRLSVRGRPTAR